MWLGPGPYYITPTDDIVVITDVSSSIFLPESPIDKRKILIKNLSSGEIVITSGNHSIDFSGFPYNLKAGEAITITFYLDGNTWVIESDYTKIVTPTGTTGPVVQILDQIPGTPYSMLPTDDIIIGYGSYNDIFLPSNSSMGKKIVIKNVGPDSENITTSMPAVIDYLPMMTSYSLISGGTITLIFDNINMRWNIESLFTIPVSGETSHITWVLPGDYNILPSDDIIVIGNLSENVYLPVTGETGKQYIIKNSIDQAISVKVTGGLLLEDQMNGYPEYKLKAHSTVTMIYNNIVSNWIVSSNYDKTDNSVTKYVGVGESYNMSADDNIIILSGATSVAWLPDIASIKYSKQYVVKNLGATTTYLFNSQTNGTDNNALPSITLTSNSAITLISDVSNLTWIIISEYKPDIVYEIITETPSGLTDGSNTTFTLSRKPKDLMSINVWVNSVLTRVINVSDNIFDLSYSPTAPSSFVAVYTALPI